MGARGPARGRNAKPHFGRGGGIARAGRETGEQSRNERVGGEGWNRIGFDFRVKNI